MTSDLRARIEALADEWEAEAAEDQAWLSGPKVEVNEARELPALIRQAGEHVRELRSLLAEPAAESGTCPCGRTPDPGTCTCDQYRGESHCSCAPHETPSAPAPAADGGEVDLDSLVRLLARHVLSHLTPEHCTADCMGRAILASSELADLRRTERAEGAREAAERIAADILIACAHFDRYKGQPGACGYCETAADIARAEAIR